MTAPAPSEYQMHCAVADLLRMAIRPGWVWWHTPNGGARPKFITKKGKRISIEGGKLQRMGTLPGVSDILLVGPPHACLHALELKQLGEHPTPDQVAFLAAVKSAGGRSAWADTFEQARVFLKYWGAIR